MKTEISYDQVPYNYIICLNRECPQANTCLRQRVEQIVPANVKYWSIISPKNLATLKGTCPHYRSDTKIRFAKGFITMLENLPHNQMQMVVSKLLRYFCQRTYYRSRKGERLLSPSEQKGILNILKTCGVANPQDFDAYVEEYDWK